MTTIFYLLNPEFRYKVNGMNNETYRMNRRSSGGFSFLGTMSMIVLLAMMGTPDVLAETTTKAPTEVEPASGVDATPATKPAPKSKPASKPESGLEEALKKLKLPGVKINAKERYVDVDASICLDQGALELIACTKNTKEHETIVALEAKAKHIHTALLLIGAKPGNPAMQKAVDKEKTRWIHLPPKGGPVDVFLVFKNKQGKEVERPISDFIEAYSDEYDDGQEEPDEEEEDDRFPTHTFLFAGSFLHGKGDGPRKYLADLSGNVISLATFGDELLCLPGIYAHAAGALSWQIDDTHLPEVGTKVKLRLRPQLAPAPDAGAVPEK